MPLVQMDKEEYINKNYVAPKEVPKIVREGQEFSSAKQKAWEKHKQDNAIVVRAIKINCVGDALVAIKSMRVTKDIWALLKSKYQGTRDLYTAVLEFENHKYTNKFNGDLRKLKDLGYVMDD